ncbi:hypothetical protein DSCO28_65570 [Desulfosarcina ovata subsp. sediminis]|uniref:Uncharacterized protein n=1 Tax=Desulfosarcina ovata subsp. sediminis TaxID=885957 RepID=A0A5K8A0R8_9BACT|nr:hypothetical protein DSCO28_65570 [Desulfosarcina ovata subsp. sediminis]
MFLGCVIGRRSMNYTASSLWPCQKHYLKNYSIDKGFFRKDIDHDFGYIIANYLAYYFVINANFTVHSKTYQTGS